MKWRRAMELQVPRTAWPRRLSASATPLPCTDERTLRRHLVGCLTLTACLTIGVASRAVYCTHPSCDVGSHSSSRLVQPPIRCCPDTFHPLCLSLLLDGLGTLALRVSGGRRSSGGVCSRREGSNDRNPLPYSRLTFGMAASNYSIRRCSLDCNLTARDGPQQTSHAASHDSPQGNRYGANCEGTGLRDWSLSTTPTCVNAQIHRFPRWIGLSYNQTV